MASLEADFPAVRACIFDMDGLLINTEDIITLSINQLLEKYGRPAFTQSIGAQLMGVPRLGQVAHLPRAICPASEDRIELALASSTKTSSYELKASGAEIKHLLSFFQSERMVLGDDPRVRQGRGKPAPDIFLVALQALNSTMGSVKTAIRPNECLVFEDSVAGVGAARRAGMRVVWVPHPDVAFEYQDRQKDVLAGRTGISEAGDNWQLGENEDGWAETMSSLEHFDYKKHGITVPSNLTDPSME